VSKHGPIHHGEHGENGVEKTQRGTFGGLALVTRLPLVAIQPEGLTDNSRWQAQRRHIRINLRKVVFKKKAQVPK
jgi:hypothetical protein